MAKHPDRVRVERYARESAQHGCSICLGSGIVEALSTPSVVTLCACVRLVVPGLKAVQA